MKRPSSSDSMFADDQNNHGFGRDYQAMLDDEACLEECGQVSEKKRRLSVDQVKALEKNFEVENKLEPDRKAQLAQELGLQPRQVAVWFQNRRARWKTKQLERDYGVLKANFDALQCNYESMKDENESLVNEIRELKSKLRGDNSDCTISVKEEPIIPEADELQIEHTSTKPLLPSSPSESDQLITDPNYNSYNDHVSVFKDGGSSDSSDSSAILNNEGSSSPNADMSSSSLLRFTTTTMTNAYQVSGEAHKGYQPQFVKIEEHNFFSGDEACNFFSDDQAPTLQWYCSESDQWS